MAKEDIFIYMVLDAWHTHVRRVDELLNDLSDTQLLEEIAPGRNRGIYLVGHLAAVHDRMMSLLGIGQSHHPDLWEPFVVKADKVVELPDAGEVRKYWSEINATLAGGMQGLSADAWFDKHTAVSTEDFEREPHRNKLNVVINRTNHLANHYGQLLLLKKGPGND